MYFVTVLERLQDNRGMFDMGDTRTVFFSSHEENCLRVINENIADIREYLYDYALLEWFEEDCMYCLSDKNDLYFERRKWFQWNEELKGYVQMDEPPFAKKIINIGIG